MVGALSYYFDTRGRLRKITFSGSTGDARFLVGWVKRAFGARKHTRQSATTVYTLGHLGRPRGRLAIAPKFVITDAEKTQRFDVELVIQSS